MDREILRHSEGEQSAERPILNNLSGSSGGEALISHTYLQK